MIYLVLDKRSLVFSPMFKDYYFLKKDNNDLQMVKNGEKQKKINLSFLFFYFYYLCFHYNYMDFKILAIF